MNATHGAAELINRRLKQLGPEYGSVMGRKYVKIFKHTSGDWSGPGRSAVEFIDPVKQLCYDAASWSKPNMYTSRDLRATVEYWEARK